MNDDDPLRHETLEFLRALRELVAAQAHVADVERRIRATIGDRDLLAYAPPTANVTPTTSSDRPGSWPIGDALAAWRRAVPCLRADDWSPQGTHPRDLEDMQYLTELVRRHTSFSAGLAKILAPIVDGLADARRAGEA